MFVRLLIFGLVSLLPSGLYAQQRPQPPCASQPVPSFGPVDGQPNVSIWRLTDADAGSLSYPACPGWRSGPFKVFVAAAGSFRHTGSAALLVARSGPGSTPPTIR